MRGILGMGVGVVPGLILVLLAEYVVKGEMQLTIGAPGILLAIAGGVAGFAIAWGRNAADKATPKL